MEFYIQVGAPTILHEERESEDLSDAIQDLFSEQAEDAILYWNGIPVRMGYKSDLGFLIDELLRLLSAVLRTDQGQYLASWTSSSFFAYWNLVWHEDQMTISAQWLAVAARYEALLNSCNTVQVNRKLFLREWKGLLRKVIEAISVTGIEIEEQQQVETLYEIEAAIPAFGQLYEAQEIALSPIIQKSPTPQEQFIIPTPVERQYADLGTKRELIRAVA